MTHTKLQGLVAATHTPFHDDGALNLAAVEQQAHHLLANNIAAAFIAGTTGESHSLTLDERRALAQRWADVTRNSTLKLIVHVGANCLADAQSLAAHAQSINAHAISALAPSYFKPKSLDALIDCCAQIATAAPSTPFYFYDIPSMTGVHLPMPAFLDAAPTRIPTLAGIKFTNWDLAAYLRCLHTAAGQFDIPWGTDEHLLAALATGAQGAVGSTYNFAAPLYHRLITAFQNHDLPTARQEQLRAIRLIDLLASFNYMPAAKATMQFLGVPVGPPRLPHQKLSTEDHTRLRKELESLGFFNWIG